MLTEWSEKAAHYVAKTVGIKKYLEDYYQKINRKKMSAL
jgi:hypothetical protein